MIIKIMNNKIMNNKFISIKKSIDLMLNVFTNTLKLLLVILGFSFIISSCKQLNSFTDFTTYFNTYYNADRLMKESEYEFEFFDEKLRVSPRVVVPTPEIFTPNFVPNGPPPFMESFIVKQNKRQPVAVKLDSIIIKGSKILSTAPKSDYVENTLYLMAKTYFYREEWLNASVKCGELVDIYPDGDLSPDAHLLHSKVLIIERKFIQGKMMLSRTVDIAWYKKRYDILSDAFKFQAELAIYEKDIDGAIRPYYQAITQSDDNKLKAKWQLELASLLYRLGYFERAEKEFAKVFKYSPDYLGQFEAKLYQAASLNRLNQYEKAAEILTEIEEDGKFTEWKGFAFAERLQAFRLQKDTANLSIAEKYADTAFIGNPAIQCYYFDKGMDHYYANEYNKAQKCFVRVQGTKTPISNTAKEMFKSLSELDERYTWTAPTLKKLSAGEELNDTIKLQTSTYLFEMSRTHEVLKNKDSAIYYSKFAYDLAPKKNPKTARFLFAYSRLIKEKDPLLSDSLYEVLAVNYMDTEFGAEAANVLGFTKEFKIDKIQELFNSGTQNRINGDYIYANKQFLKLYEEHPQHELAARSLYTIGWIFENKLRVNDSAFYYYKLLIDKYPSSIYANEVRGSLTLYAAALANGGVVPDSLVMKKETYQKANLAEEEKKYKEQLKVLERQNQEQRAKNEQSPFDILNPSNLMDKATEIFQGQIEKTISTDPMSLLPKVPSLDSLGISLPPSISPAPVDSNQDVDKDNNGNDNNNQNNRPNNSNPPIQDSTKAPAIKEPKKTKKK